MFTLLWFSLGVAGTIYIFGVFLSIYGWLVLSPLYNGKEELKALLSSILWPLYIVYYVITGLRSMRQMRLEKMATIWADFNAIEKDGLISLETRGSKKDIKNLKVKAGDYIFLSNGETIYMALVIKKDGKLFGELKERIESNDR